MRAKSSPDSHRASDRASDRHYRNHADSRRDAGAAAPENGGDPRCAAERNAGVGEWLLEFHERAMGLDAGALGSAATTRSGVGAGTLGSKSRWQNVDLDGGVLGIASAEPGTSKFERRIRDRVRRCSNAGISGAIGHLAAVEDGRCPARGVTR